MLSLINLPLYVFVMAGLQQEISLRQDQVCNGILILANSNITSTGTE